MSRQLSTKQFVRGGQIILHQLRMFNQISNRVLLLILTSGLLLMLGWFFLRTGVYERYFFLQWLWAHLNLFLSGHAATQSIVQPTGQKALIYSTTLLNSPLTRHYTSHLQSVFISGFLCCVLVGAVGLVGTILYLQKKGHQHIKAKRIKGDYLEKAETVRDTVIQDNKASDFRMGSVKLPLIQGTEQQHILIDGTTGAGKSTTIKELLDQIRLRGDRVIFWDEGGHYISEFYDQTRDHIVNDLDERGLAWHLWDECHDIADFENMATALIPMTNAQDPFWVLGARTIFSEVAYSMRDDPDRHVQKLLKTLLTASLDNIKTCLEDTFASILVSEKIEKTAISIKSVMAAYLKCLRYVKDTDNAFSIRRWVQEDDQQGWLFFSSVEKKHEALKPLITARLDIAINELLSLSANEHRRVWIILDELTSLHKIPTLLKILSKGRKPGACVVIGIQNYAQLADVYGTNGAKIISSLLNTRFMFRQPDPELAAWSARNLGESVINEVREGISYGANTLRDGVSINHQEVKKAVVSASEMMRLDDLNCFVRLPGDYPITKLSFNYKQRDRLHVPYQQRELDQSKFTEIDELISTHEKPMVRCMDEAYLDKEEAISKVAKKKAKNVMDHDDLFEI